MIRDGPAEPTGQLHEKAGVAGGSEALVADQYSDQADQNRRTASAPRKEAGVSVPTPSTPTRRGMKSGLAEVLVTREMPTGILERISRLRLAPG